MQEIIFKPEYPLNMPKYLWLFPFVVLLLLSIMPINAFSLFVLAGSFIFIELLMVGFYMIIVKEIRFGDCITISRYLRRDQIAQYADVQDILPGGFRVDGIYVYWYNSNLPFNMKNGDELREILQGLVEKGIIDKSKFPEKMSLTQALITAIAGIGLGTVLMITAFLFELLPTNYSRDLAVFIGLIYLFSFLIAAIAGKYFFIDKKDT